jgi:hypothetical protein
MSASAQIDYECFEELIRQLQTGGCPTTARKLDSMLHQVAWTTGSELLGELGSEILAFQRATPSAGAELQDTLSRCMEMVSRVWPGIK